MKICFVNSYYPPYIGGAERYVSSLARELATRGHEVVVYCAKKGESKDSAEILDFVRIHRMGTPMSFYGTPISIFPASFFLDEFDIVHANFPNPYFALVSATLSRLKDTPAVLTWHNDLPAVTKPAGILVRLHDSLVAKVYLPKYRRIIATSSLYAGSSRILRMYADRVVVIPNGVDTRKFNPARDGARVRELYGLKDEFIALFVGALTKWHIYKGLDVLLNAFKNLRERRAEKKLIVVGSGELLSYYKMLSARLGIQNDVIFAGSVSDEELPDYYAASDVLVLPSKDRSEGFGIVLLEAMASGKPVIASNVGGIPSTVIDGETGILVPPNNSIVLADAITRICEEKEERARMGKNARVLAEKYDWRKIACEIEELYSKILSEPAKKNSDPLQERVYEPIPAVRQNLY